MLTTIFVALGGWFVALAGGATRPLEWRSWLGLAQGPHKHWLAGQGCDAIRIERSAMMLQQRGI